MPKTKREPTALEFAWKQFETRPSPKTAGSYLGSALDEWSDEIMPDGTFHGHVMSVVVYLTTGKLHG